MRNTKQLCYISAVANPRNSKIYWLPLPARAPQTCAFVLDADPRFPDAKDRFGLRTISIAAARVVNFCLLRSQRLGKETIGETGKIIGELIRLDSGGVTQIEDREGQVQSISVPGFGGLLWMTKTANGSLEDT